MKIEEFKTETLAFGAMYIMPNGEMLDLSILPNGHAEFFALTNTTSDCLKSQGWVRLNTKLKYIELPAQPLTKQQETQIKRALAFMGDNVQIKR